MGQFGEENKGTGKDEENQVENHVEESTPDFSNFLSQAGWNGLKGLHKFPFRIRG